MGSAGALCVQRLLNVWRRLAFELLQKSIYVEAPERRQSGGANDSFSRLEVQLLIVSLSSSQSLVALLNLVLILFLTPTSFPVSPDRSPHRCGSATPSKRRPL
eukprot:GHVU01158090.1.p1 GENE.GHVU01158090.1~~GHVU01158090.1.p1  ORF type:complete len:103 (+),score=0.85 GHVU01158090.1:840-1148(+)